MSRKPQSLGEKFKDALINPELDKVRSEVQGALKKAKEHPENSQLSTSLLDRGLAGLDADLAELNIPVAQRKAYREAYESRFKTATEGLESKAISESLEGKKLDAFINDYAKYARLDAVIEDCKKQDSKKPLKRFVQTIRKATPILAPIGASIMGWLNSGKEEEKKMRQASWKQKQLRLMQYWPRITKKKKQIQEPRMTRMPNQLPTKVVEVELK